MKKLLLTLITFASFASADYLLNTTYQCIKSYYFLPASGEVLYTFANSGNIMMTTTKNLADDFIPGYQYNATTGRCELIPPNNSLGLSNDDYTYYMSLTGIICGTLLVSSVFIGLRISA